MRLVVTITCAPWGKLFLLVSLFYTGHLAESYGNRLMVQLEGGPFQMGIDDFKEGKNGESPSYPSKVKPFMISKYLVTNKEFQTFMRNKKYVTDAESRGWSNVFSSYAKQLNPKMLRAAQHHAPTKEEPWMSPMIGASYKKPLGPGSNITNKDSHPVVHVSKRDSAAFCFWREMRLPTEYEWEYAARGGLKGLEYPWGDTYELSRTNLWQGTFPSNDSAADGFAGTSPVSAFQPQNFYGMKLSFKFKDF